MSRHYVLLMLALMLALGGVSLEQAGTSPGGQNPSPAPEKASGVIKTESNLVLVDVVATDKKGNYIKNLQKEDFHVYEDEAEQPIASFSREADMQPGSPGHQHYMVLFFDDSGANSASKLQARQVAGKFVEGSASSGCQMAVAVLGGGMKIAQNFTADRELLKRAVSLARNLPVNPNARGEGQEVGPDYVPRGLQPGFSRLAGLSPLLAITELAKSLRAVPGRKTLLLFSGGFSVKSDRLPELVTAIDALNKANVAVYPVDVRGVGIFSTPAELEFPTGLALWDPGPTSGSVLHDLAKGTGGFEIFNSNDPLPELQRVAKESEEYYNLAYVLPRQTHDGSYHKIKVTVERPGVVVRCRPGYFDSKDPDLLKGMPEGKVLEERAASQEAGKIPVSLSAPYFYVEPGVARVNLALSVPGSAIEFAKHNGSFHSDVNVLGIAYRENGSVAARFSDKVKLNYAKQAVKDFAKSSFDYQNTFKIAPGSYTLKVVLNAGGEKFGKYVTPLVVGPYTGRELSLGGPALGERYVPVSQQIITMDAALSEKYTPLVFQAMVLVPSTTYRFAKGAEPAVYVEIYDPALKSEGDHRVGVEFFVIDRKNNQRVYSSNGILINEHLRPGNPVVPMGFKLPIGKLQAGDYRLEIRARDSAGAISSMHTADFSIQ